PWFSRDPNEPAPSPKRLQNPGSPASTRVYSRGQPVRGKSVRDRTLTTKRRATSRCWKNVVDRIQFPAPPPREPRFWLEARSALSQKPKPKPKLGDGS